MENNLNQFAGCLLGGALGDALGAPVETLTYKQITREYGHDGITELQCNTRGLAEITNDTQLTLFTAEGLLRAKCRREKKGLENDLRETTHVIFRAYLRWLYTQGLSTSNWSRSDYDGWLVGVKKLYTYANKQVETTTITSLGKGIAGRLSKPINKSSTCGAVFRVAPIGLYLESPDQAFELGKRVGAITHGHPLAYYSSGAFSLLIHHIIQGMTIREATLDVIQELGKYEEAKGCVDQLELALALHDKKTPYLRAFNELGSGRQAIEALSIGVFCALTYPNDAVKALRLSVNHSGDSDSTGSITGNIVGAALGKDALPQDWLKQLELAKEIEIIATDLAKGHCQEEDWTKKYPAW